MMTDALKITEAKSEQDYRAGGELILGFLNWNRARLDKGWPREAFEIQEHIRDDVINLGRRHLEGWTIYIGRIGSEVVGCVAIRPLSEKVCELKRLFVVEHLRRAGVGRVLCKFALDAARQRGFGRMMLDTADVQNEATALFVDLGFEPCPPYKAYPEEVLKRVHFMEARLN
jgi:GNAT superfamily N-acetyltransferase